MFSFDCLLVCLFIHLFMYIAVPFVYLFIYPFISLVMCSAIHLFNYIFICSFVQIIIHDLSAYLFTYLFIHYLFIPTQWFYRCWSTESKSETLITKLKHWYQIRDTDRRTETLIPKLKHLHQSWNTDDKFETLITMLLVHSLRHSVVSLRLDPNSCPPGSSWGGRPRRTPMRPLVRV